MWDALFYPGKVIAQLVLPPTGFVLLALIALLFLKRRPRVARTVLCASLGALLILSLPATARGLMSLLDTPTLDLDAARSHAKAIVVLGGGLTRATPEYGDTLSPASLRRVRFGAKLAKELELPLLVTGGQVFGGTPEADVMASVLANEFGVAPRWVENRSRNTVENARNAAELLQREGIDSVVLVTDAPHMRRGLRHCADEALICHPAPVSVVGRASDSWIERLPNAGALHSSSYALQELLGNLVARLR
jgi:uncharacterized SAM-binding protein YcdF (DUF218 family)